MADAAAPWATTISAMTSALLAGDDADGEELLLAARALVEHRARVSAPSTPDGLFNGSTAATE